MGMYLAYIDESGDNGTDYITTPFFVLSCVLIHESDWLHNLDAMISLRRHLKSRWGINTRAELKAQDFRWGHGALKVWV
jgi:hypothetical protein